MASAGCRAGATTAVKDQRHDLQSGGEQRWYFLTTPSVANGRRPMPLVVDLHGLAEGAGIHVQMTQFGRLAQAKKFIVATPNGTGSPVGWKIGDESPSNPDLQFVTKLLDDIEAKRCIDTSRVYATGLSDGALFSSLLACTMSNRFTAIAPVAGVAMAKTCTTSRPVPVLAIHGTADPILLFNGGVGDRLSQVLGGKSNIKTTSTTVPTDLHGTGYPAAVAAWAAKDGCDHQATDKRIARDVIRRTYSCPAGVGVEFLIVIGGGHSWPGSQLSKSIANIVGPTSFSFDATAEIYRWLHQYRLSKPA
ncbi:MAG: hypothetical protein M3Z46_07665 [Actinomycetota bacterium]|nr:hypothetical protein [Actinomycetota bacterium]